MKTFDVADFGAKGRAFRDRSLYCAARTHAGWRSGADLHAEIFASNGSESEKIADQLGIQQAIDEAHAAGGGRVVVPRGDYLVGPLRLRSGVDLHLEAGATLFGRPELSPYESMAASETHPRDPSLVTQEKRRGGMTGRVVQSCLLEAFDSEEVSLTGPGCLSQQSGAFFIPWWAAEKSFELRRPARMVRFLRCRGVRIGGVRLKDSCGWTLTFDQCEDVRVRDVSIRNLHGPNVDGIDVVDSRHVVIEGCDIFTTDDAICLKSFDPAGGVERVRVNGCFLRTLCNGFKIGSESLGRFRDIMVSDLTIYNPDGDLHDAAAAVALCCMDGGVIENVSLSNIQVRHARAPFYFVVGKRTVHQQEFRFPRAGVIRHVSLAGLMSSGAQLPALMSGLAESPILDVQLSNLQVQSQGGVSAWPETVPVLPEAYPAPDMFGILPAAGLFAREVEGFSLRDFQFRASEVDRRPVCAFASVRDAMSEDTFAGTPFQISAEIATD